jgi:hypothetical protein
MLMPSIMAWTWPASGSSFIPALAQSMVKPLTLT